MTHNSKTDFTNFNYNTLSLLLILIFFPFWLIFIILASFISGQTKLIVTIVILLCGFLPLIFLGIAFSQAGNSAINSNSSQNSTISLEEKVKSDNIRKESIARYYSKPVCKFDISYIWNYFILDNCIPAKQNSYNLQ